MRPIFVIALRVALSLLLPTLVAALEGCAAHDAAAAHATAPTGEELAALRAEIRAEMRDEVRDEVLAEIAAEARAEAGGSEEVAEEAPSEPAQVAEAQLEAQPEEAQPEETQPEEAQPEPQPATASLLDPVSEAGQRARGVYLGVAFIRDHSADEIADLMEMTHMTAAVIDLKDAQGQLVYASQAYRRETGLDAIPEGERAVLPDPAALVRDLRARGIYTIARIVAFADRRLPEAQPARAVMDTRRDRPWVSWGTGGTWLDPYNARNQRLVIALAREAEGMGFHEVQLDYIRFPVDDGVQFARFPGQDQRTHGDVLTAFLRDMDLALGIPIGVDVFGLTAFNFGHRSALGQELARWTPYVEVFSPMLYPYAMRSWGRGRPHRERSLIQAGISQMRRRLGPLPVIRPFLQAFSHGADHYNPEFISEQVVGARRGGADGVLFWHAGSVYGNILSEGIRRLHQQREFPIERRMEARQAEAARRRPAHQEGEEEREEAGEEREQELVRSVDRSDLHARVERRQLHPSVR